MKEERRQEKRGAGGKRWGEDEWGGARKLRADGAGGVGSRPRQEVGDRSLKVGRLRGLGRHLGSGGARALRVAPLEGDAEARHPGAEHGRHRGVPEVAQSRRAGDRARGRRLEEPQGLVPPAPVGLDG